MDYTGRKKALKAVMMCAAVLVIAAHGYLFFMSARGDAPEVDRLTIYAANLETELGKLKIEKETRDQNSEIGRNYVNRAAEILAPFGHFFIDSPKIKAGQILEPIQEAAKIAEVSLSSLVVNGDNSPWNRDLEKSIRVSVEARGSYGAMRRFFWELKQSQWLFLTEDMFLNMHADGGKCRMNLIVRFSKS
ncbi:MAG: hypothetical protein CVV64_07260 [Candidatus Wallbacteria bacterium HGW-Wallbacteria-1]|jgi:hypothetical protein|uniref:Uncharacterized protein n=1 Tax=Candidatus Wallbacteria bacterium HGW-Wallbacteria-1 TaxID=2013854 RepID=A0A2N1PQP9_9BACT|nr:MAG: hypothetical protein CVV64_07260 [Candidatus Wallbacteria bacterium HGW-Wallbacteria-1]